MSKQFTHETDLVSKQFTHKISLVSNLLTRLISWSKQFTDETESRQENSFAKTDFVSKLWQFTSEISLVSKLFSVYSLDQSHE